MQNSPEPRSGRDVAGGPGEPASLESQPYETPNAAAAPGDPAWSDDEETVLAILVYAAGRRFLEQ